MSVPRSSGGNFILPTTAFLALEVATAMFRAGSISCAVEALEDERVKGDAASLVLGTLRKNNAGVASFECNFPPCACAAADATCLALWQVGELVWLDAIISMNSTVM